MFSSRLFILSIAALCMLCISVHAQDLHTKLVKPVYSATPEPAPPTVSYPRAAVRVDQTDKVQGMPDNPNVASGSNGDDGGNSSDSPSILTKTPASPALPTMTKIPVMGASHSGATGGLAFPEPGVVMLGFAFGLITLGLGLV